MYSPEEKDKKMFESNAQRFETVCFSMPNNKIILRIRFFMEVSIAKRTFQHILWPEVCKSR